VGRSGWGHCLHYCTAKNVPFVTVDECATGSPQFPLKSASEGHAAAAADPEHAADPDSARYVA